MVAGSRMICWVKSIILGLLISLTMSCASISFRMSGSFRIFWKRGSSDSDFASAFDAIGVAALPFIVGAPKNFSPKGLAKGKRLNLSHHCEQLSILLPKEGILLIVLK